MSPTTRAAVPSHVGFAPVPMPTDSAAPLAAAILRALPVVRADADGPVSQARALTKRVASLRQDVTVAVIAGDVRDAARLTLSIAFASGCSSFLRSDGRHEFRSDSFRSVVSLLGAGAHAAAADNISPMLATLAKRAEGLEHGELYYNAVTVNEHPGALSSCVRATIPEGADAAPWRIALGTHVARWADAVAVLALTRPARVALEGKSSRRGRNPAKWNVPVGAARALRPMPRRAFASAWRDVIAGQRGASVLIPRRLVQTTPDKARSPRAAPVPDKVLDLVISSPWAISEEGMRRVLAVASRKAAFPEALQQRAGERLDNTHAVRIRDGVATIPIRGVLAQRAGLFSSVSGATSYETIALDLTVALEDPAVSSILLAIDSPGGEVAGCHELWEQLISARGIKPIEAYIGGDGASAAYWLATAADRIHASETAVVGSLGVRMSAVDDTRAMRRAGYDRIEIISSQTPAKAADLTADDGRAQVQRMVDDLAEVFLKDVASARRTSLNAVRTKYGRGDVFVGRTALERGLIDAIGTEESVHAALAARSH